MLFFIGLSKLQLDNGCYTASIDGTESDMRFLFCAASICHILSDFTAIDVDKAVKFILESIVSSHSLFISVTFLVSVI